MIGQDQVLASALELDVWIVKNIQMDRIGVNKKFNIQRDLVGVKNSLNGS